MRKKRFVPDCHAPTTRRASFVTAERLFVTAGDALQILEAAMSFERYSKLSRGVRRRFVLDHGNFHARTRLHLLSPGVQLQLEPQQRAFAGGGGGVRAEIRKLFAVARAVGAGTVFGAGPFRRCGIKF